MCIIVSKNKGVKMPGKEILRNCFNSNKEGAGYMIARNGVVEINKGFMDFESFYKAIQNEGNLENYSVVMHFRISTQGGVNRKLCHPYPLSENMQDLKKLNTVCDIGIAHNGIISLTSEGYNYGYSYGKYSTPDYNDTMKFITDYLSLIIKDKNFYKDDNTLTLIERLCESKLAILDNEGHITYIGDFNEFEGVMYSNMSYIEKRQKKAQKSSNKQCSMYDYGCNNFDIDYYYNEFDNCYDKKTNQFSFDDLGICPYDLGDDSYCQDCDGKYCGMFDCIKEDLENETRPDKISFDNRDIDIDWTSFDKNYNCVIGFDQFGNIYEIEFEDNSFKNYTITMLR